MGLLIMKLVFQPSIFRGYVSFRDGNHHFWNAHLNLHRMVGIFEPSNPMWQSALHLQAGDPTRLAWGLGFGVGSKPIMKVKVGFPVYTWIVNRWFIPTIAGFWQPPQSLWSWSQCPASRAHWGDSKHWQTSKMKVKRWRSNEDHIRITLPHFLR